MVIRKGYMRNLFYHIIYPKIVWMHCIFGRREYVSAGTKTKKNYDRREKVDGWIKSLI